MSDSSVQIRPRCKLDMCTYVSAEAIVYPCCWIANEPHVREYKDFHGAELARLDAGKRRLSEILADPQYRKLEASWATESPFATCKIFCDRPLPKSEEVTMSGTNEIKKLDLKNVPRAEMSAPPKSHWAKVKIQSLLRQARKALSMHPFSTRSTR